MALMLLALVSLRVCRGGVAPLPASPAVDASTVVAPAEAPMPAGVPTVSPVEPADGMVAEGVSGLPIITYADLPAEARTTLALIQQEGPFPFARDGLTFQNRERLLPLKSANYYREYTVITPGASDRGARRIVAGASGEFYYTDDHYASFWEIVR